MGAGEDPHPTEHSSVYNYATVVDVSSVSVVLSLR